MVNVRPRSFLSPASDFGWRKKREQVFESSWMITDNLSFQVKRFWEIWFELILKSVSWKMFGLNHMIKNFRWFSDHFNPIRQMYFFLQGLFLLLMRKRIYKQNWSPNLTLQPNNNGLELFINLVRRCIMAMYRRIKIGGKILLIHDSLIHIEVINRWFRKIIKFLRERKRKRIRGKGEGESGRGQSLKFEKVKS